MIILTTLIFTSILATILCINYESISYRGISLLFVIWLLIVMAPDIFASLEKAAKVTKDTTEDIQECKD